MDGGLSTETVFTARKGVSYKNFSKNMSVPVSFGRNPWYNFLGGLSANLNVEYGTHGF